MTNMLPTIVPKSDQLNADDLIGKTSITIKITKVAGVSGDQPIAISYEGDNGKPYKPCKSMRRVMVQVWGDKGNEYVGRSLTLYRDPEVMFGGIKTGGIRISHMSHINEPMTMALTATRSNRKPYTVKPLIEDKELTVEQQAEKLAASKDESELKELFGSFYKKGGDNVTITHTYNKRKTELTI